MNIALLGDYNEEVTAHRAIPVALDLAARSIDQTLDVQWIHSTEVPAFKLDEMDGLWCVPASPYENMDNILWAIRFARTHNVPFLGTCGGYQHAALEFARNVLEYQQADNAEVNPDTTMPLISSLSCSLIDESDRISFTEDSVISRIYGQDSTVEEYRCGYGVNKNYLRIYEGSAMQFTGFDADQDPRVLEIQTNWFFIATAYQPERSAFKELVHPLIKEFVVAAGRVNGGCW